MTLGYTWECLPSDLIFHLFIQQILTDSPLHCVLSYLRPSAWGMMAVGVTESVCDDQNCFWREHHVAFVWDGLKR